VATRRINGNTYSEFAVVAAEPIPVDIGGATVDISGAVTIGNVTIDNDSTAPVPISDAGGTLSVDDGGVSLTVDGTFLTDTQLRASPVPVSVGSSTLPSGASTAALQATGNTSLGSIDSKLPALASGRVPVDASGATVPVSGPLTNTELRATPVPVSGALTDAELRAAPVPVQGPLTDSQLRASAVPVASTVPGRTPTTVSVESSSTSQLIIAQNSNRKGLMINNLSQQKLYLSFTSPATQANCFMQLYPDDFIAFDQQLIFPNAVYGLWAAASGRAQVTELV